MLSWRESEVLALTCSHHCVLLINKDTGRWGQASILMFLHLGSYTALKKSMIFKKRSKKDPAIFSESKQMPDSRPRWAQFALEFGPALFSSLATECLLIGLKEEVPKISLFISHGLGGIKVLTPGAGNCKHALIADTITLQVTESVLFFLPFSCLWWGLTPSPVFPHYS